MTTGDSRAANIKSILLVDDCADSRLTTKWFLANMGYAIECAGSAEEALRMFDPRVHDVVLTDNSMPGMSGSEMAHIIKLRAPATPVVMYSGNLPEDRTCLDALIEKPVHLLIVHETIAALVSSPAGANPETPAAIRQTGRRTASVPPRSHPPT